ncbi:DUF3616 domain-containing protein [Aphanothece hegewaldii CCALA 016]|uniref:DUF3616 domain-containing protein n=1 Tax=Aphanothece hegewaldii CCALA 016 TaxID=2107694 RepID=A0A2T1M1F3_9CHRO|nr:DUF3616 domain-containing protein [Aphanothece hegewaldii]PSF38523.1 DUF3616 domain-containing protein [Aphanothece hegewaldii CCALA 016]
MNKSSSLIKQLKLNFEPQYQNKEPKYSDPEKPVTEQLSAAVFTENGKYLWLAADEEIAIERLEKIDDKTYGNHQRFALQDLLDDFDPKQKEVDIEGLDYDGQYLWLIGSHSSKRKKAKENPISGKQLTVALDGNRYLLARIPIKDGKLIKSTESEHSAVLKREPNSNELLTVLAQDPYLGEIIRSNLPGKDNGFDIEGFVIKNNKILIGLRGPVLRGIAILIEIELEEAQQGILTLKTIGTDEKGYKLHFIDLNGLGIRELCMNENNLLILAGPTMSLDASMRLFQLNDPFSLQENSLTEAQDNLLKILFEIPHGFQNDRAEGITLYTDENERKSILVVYDTPNKQRLDNNEFTVLSDIFQLP